MAYGIIVKTTIGDVDLADVKTLRNVGTLYPALASGGTQSVSGYNSTNSFVLCVAQDGKWALPMSYSTSGWISWPTVYSGAYWTTSFRLEVYAI